MRRALVASFFLIVEICAASGDARFFDRKVAPILRQRCLGCHNDTLNDGGISFQGLETLLTGGVHGRAVVPGKPDESVLIHAIRRDGELKMPPGKPLTKREVLTLTRWVQGGAAWGSPIFLSLR